MPSHRPGPNRRQFLRILVLLATSTGPWLTGGGVEASPLFPNQVMPVGRNPLFVITGDFNGDGKDDLAASNYDSNDVSIVLGDAEAGFSAERRTVVGTSPFGMAVLDVNGDGRDDLAVANYGSDNISILLSVGDGRFNPFVPPLFTGSTPISLGSGDFDRDGLPDLVVLNQGEFEAVILKNDHGGGVFGEMGRLATGVSPTVVVVGDLNRDGLEDLAVANGGSDDVISFLGHGDGTFSRAGSFAVGHDPESMVASDLNGDGIIDLVTANTGSDDVSVLMGAGDGTFSSQVRYATLDSPSSVAAIDTDGDGVTDLALANPGPFGTLQGDLTLLRGIGGGLFAPAVPLGAGTGFTALAAGYFDQNPRADLVALRSSVNNPGEISVFMNGSLAPTPLPLVPMLGDFNELALSDVNDDGIPDLAAVFGPDDDTGGLGVTRVWLGAGDGSFAPSDDLPIDSESLRLVMGDLDGDRFADLIVLDLTHHQVIVDLSRGDGTFDALAPLDAGPDPRSIALGEMTDDGRLDLILGQATAVGGEAWVFAGNGNGTFGAPLPTVLNHLADSIIVGDFNDDGRQDLAIAGITTLPPTNGSVSVLLRDGAGRFEREQLYGRISAGSRLVLGDFNGDHHQDLGVSGTVLDGPFYNAGLFVLMGAGDGTFVEQPPFAIGQRAGQLSLADDMDRDGRSDLVAAITIQYPDPFGYSLESRLVIYRGLTNGQFDAPLTYREAGNGEAAAGDINRDGRSDLAVPVGGGASIWLNQGPFAGNHPPVARAMASSRDNCSQSVSMIYRFEGTLSTDPDSSPGTNDDIVAYDWFEDFGEASERSLGAGQLFEVRLSFGSHRITLRVTDRQGATGFDEVTVQVADTTPPSISVSPDPAVLDSPKHQMVEVHLTVGTGDDCSTTSVVLESVTSSEPDDAQGGADGSTVNDIQDASLGTADYTILLRAERDQRGPGRVYTITYSATDQSGNRSTRATTVTVPKGKPHGSNRGNRRVHTD